MAQAPAVKRRPFAWYYHEPVTRRVAKIESTVSTSKHDFSMLPFYHLAFDQTRNFSQYRIPKRKRTKDIPTEASLHNKRQRKTKFSWSNRPPSDKENTSPIAEQQKLQKQAGRKEVQPIKQKTKKKSKPGKQPETVSEPLVSVPMSSTLPTLDFELPTHLKEIVRQLATLWECNSYQTRTGWYRVFSNSVTTHKIVVHTATSEMTNIRMYLRPLILQSVTNYVSKFPKVKADPMTVLEKQQIVTAIVYALYTNEQKQQVSQNS